LYMGLECYIQEIIVFHNNNADMTCHVNHSADPTQAELRVFQALKWLANYGLLKLAKYQLKQLRKKENNTLLKGRKIYQRPRALSIASLPESIIFKGLHVAEAKKMVILAASLYCLQVLDIITTEDGKKQEVTSTEKPTLLSTTMVHPPAKSSPHHERDLKESGNELMTGLTMHYHHRRNTIIPWTECPVCSSKIHHIDSLKQLLRQVWTFVIDSQENEVSDMISAKNLFHSKLTISLPDKKPMMLYNACWKYFLQKCIEDRIDMEEEKHTSSYRADSYLSTIVFLSDKISQKIVKSLDSGTIETVQPLEYFTELVERLSIQNSEFGCNASSITSIKWILTVNLGRLLDGLTEDNDDLVHNTSMTRLEKIQDRETIIEKIFNALEDSKLRNQSAHLPQNIELKTALSHLHENVRRMARHKLEDQRASLPHRFHLKQHFKENTQSPPSDSYDCLRVEEHLHQPIDKTRGHGDTHNYFSELFGHMKLVPKPHITQSEKALPSYSEDYSEYEGFLSRIIDHMAHTELENQQAEMVSSRSYKVGL
jgi:hypothetical protein